jgi:hypothetical protein
MTIATALIGGAVAGAASGALVGAVGGGISIPVVGAIPGAVLGAVAGGITGILATTILSIGFGQLGIRDTLISAVSDLYRRWTGSGN